MIPRNARVRIVDPGDRRRGDYGTVTRGEHPSILCRRPCVEVHLDGDDPRDDEVWYVEQVEETNPSLAAGRRVTGLLFQFLHRRAK